jgi:hypothetical protein
MISELVPESRKQVSAYGIDDESETSRKGWETPGGAA